MKKAAAVLLILLLLPISVKAENLSVFAKSAVLINGDNGEIIYEKNSDLKLSMASTTKIMTALLLCEYGKPQKEITVTKEMVTVEGSSMGLLAGDKVTLHDLLYGLMLASGNDAANVAAYAVGGNLKNFVGLMNKKAQELGLYNTHFETPSGLDGKSHYTTAYDLALLTRYAMQNEEFCNAVSCQKATLCYGNPPYKRTLTNHNKLLKMRDFIVGVKTGFTKKSGRCLVSAAKKDGKFVIAVTLNDRNDWQDHIKMLDYGLKAIKQTKVSPQSDSYNIPVIGGKSDCLTVKVKPLTVNSLDTGDIDCTVHLPRFVYAPVSKGEKVGKAVYRKNGKPFCEAELLADKSINPLQNGDSMWKKIFNNIKTILKCV